MNQSRTTHCIELLCQRGCKEVNQVILALEKGESIQEMQGLSESECQTVLQELKTIMAVYDKKTSE